MTPKFFVGQPVLVGVATTPEEAVVITKIIHTKDLITYVVGGVKYTEANVAHAVPISAPA